MSEPHDEIIPMDTSTKSRKIQWKFKPKALNDNANNSDPGSLNMNELDKEINKEFPNIMNEIKNLPPVSNNINQGKSTLINNDNDNDDDDDNLIHHNSEADDIELAKSCKHFTDDCYEMATFAKEELSALAASNPALMRQAAPVVNKLLSMLKQGGKSEKSKKPIKRERRDPFEDIKVSMFFYSFITFTNHYVFLYFLL